jgi:membrane protein
VNVFARAEAAYHQAVRRARKRWPIVDHTWAAADRFEEVLGARLAAAISYYAFFAAFSLAVVVYSILGRLLNGTNSAIIGTINNYLSTSLPWVRTTADQVGTTQVTTFGAIGLVLTGVAWVDALRSSTRAIWRLDQHPGNWILRRVIDLGMLVALGLLLALSLAAANAIDFVIDHVARPTTGAFAPVLLRATGPLLEFLINLVLAGAVLVVVPRLRLSPRRLFPAAALVAIGIQLLNTIGGLYINRTESRPAYQLVAGAVGLLIYLYLLNQLILYGCAVAATSPKGSAADLAEGRPQPLDGDSPASAQDGPAAADAGPEAGGRCVTDGTEGARPGPSPVNDLGEPRPRQGVDPR